MADTEFKGELIEASHIANPCGAGKAKTEEQTENPYIGKVGNGAFAGLTGVDAMDAKLNMIEAMIAGKGNPKTEIFGEDIQENNYAFRIAEACAHLDENIVTEIDRLNDFNGSYEYFEAPEKIGWSYTAKTHKFGNSLGCSTKKFENETWTSEKDRFKILYIIKTTTMGCTDVKAKAYGKVDKEGNLHKAQIKNQRPSVDVTEKANLMIEGIIVDEDECINGIETIHHDSKFGGYVKFHVGHWITGDMTEVYYPKQMTTKKPVLALNTPLYVNPVKLLGFETSFPFVIGDKTIQTEYMSSTESKIIHKGRSIKISKDIEVIYNVLTEKPQFGSDIIKATGLTKQKVNNCLKVMVGMRVVKTMNLKNIATRKTQPTFFI